jgi:hypothetical protein
MYSDFNITANTKEEGTIITLKLTLHSSVLNVNTEYNSKTYSRLYPRSHTPPFSYGKIWRGDAIWFKYHWQR